MGKHSKETSRSQQSQAWTTLKELLMTKAETPKTDSLNDKEVKLQTYRERLLYRNRLDAVKRICALPRTLLQDASCFWLQLYIRDSRSVSQLRRRCHISYSLLRSHFDIGTCSSRMNEFLDLSIRLLFPRIRECSIRC